METRRASDRASQELNEVQTEYNKKKKDLVEQKKRELAQTQEYYQSRIENEQNSGEAAVNHIRQRNQKEIAALSDRVKTEQEKADERVSTIQLREQERQRKLGDTTNQASRELQEHQSKAQIQAQQDMERLQQKATLERARVQDQTKTEMQKLQDRYNEQLKNTEKQRQDHIGRIREQSEQDVQRVAVQNERQLKTEKEQGEKRLKATQEKLRADLIKQQTIGETKIEQQRTENNDDLERVKQQGQDKRVKTTEGYQRELEKFTNLGDARIRDQKDKTDREEKRIKEQHHHEIENERVVHEKRKQDMADAYQKQFVGNKKAYEGNLDRQSEQFQSIYLKNQATNHESLAIQKEVYLREIADLKRKLANKLEYYGDRKDDPFYKVQDNGSKLIETPNSYIIKTWVPPHEKDNVRIKVKDDGAIVSGTRSFVDKVEGEEKKLSTNNYQTFKEEFSFDKPVAIRAVRQERDGDQLTVTIPKIGTLNLKG